MPAATFGAVAPATSLPEKARDPDLECERQRQKGLVKAQRDPVERKEGSGGWWVWATVGRPDR